VLGGVGVGNLKQMLLIPLFEGKGAVRKVGEEDK